MNLSRCLTFKLRRDLITIQAAELPDKTIDEVQRYSKTFWERHTEVEGAFCSCMQSVCGN